MADPQQRLLSDQSAQAIAAIVTSAEDVETVFSSVGLAYKHGTPLVEPDALYAPLPRDNTKTSLEAADLSNPVVVSRVLRAAARLAELYQASKDFDGVKLVRLRMALEADGFRVGTTGDPIAALAQLAVSASTALTDVSGIRAELRRLERTLPADPGAAIGSAKNLVEATAKAVLAYRGAEWGETEKLPALAAKAMQELDVHPKTAGAERAPVRRLLGRLQGIVQDLADLRNDAGDGHGAAAAPTDLDARHAHLAAWSAIGWCSFMLDTLGRPHAVAGADG